jgi:hypothetical protein
MAQIQSAWDQYTASAAKRQQADVERNRAKRGLEQEHRLRGGGQATDNDVARAEEQLNDAEEAFTLHSERGCPGRRGTSVTAIPV